jgi:hypothetical protein
VDLERGAQRGTRVVRGRMDEDIVERSAAQ